MASDIDQEAEFNTASYKYKKERKLKKREGKGKFFAFLVFFQKQRKLFLFFKNPP
jgi:hypothetical protein